MFNATFHYFSKETSLIKRTSPSKIRDIYFIYITLSSFIRREKARAPRARIQPKISPLLGEEKRNSRNVEYTLKGDKHNQGTAARHKGTNGPPPTDTSDKNLIVVQRPLLCVVEDAVAAIPRVSKQEWKGRANRIEQIATLSKLSGRADRREKNARCDC